MHFQEKGQTEQTREAVKGFKEKLPTEGKEALKEQRKTYEYATPEDRLQAVAKEYTAQKDRAVALAPDAAERRELTQLIRDELKNQGRLTEN